MSLKEIEDKIVLLEKSVEEQIVKLTLLKDKVKKLTVRSILKK